MPWLGAAASMSHLQLQYRGSLHRYGEEYIYGGGGGGGQVKDQKKFLNLLLTIGMWFVLAFVYRVHTHTLYIY